MPTAFILGLSCQDGSFLSEFHLGKGYRIVGTEPYLEKADLTGIPREGSAFFGWKQKVNFHVLVRMTVDADLVARQHIKDSGGEETGFLVGGLAISPPRPQKPILWKWKL